MSGSIGTHHRTPTQAAGPETFSHEALLYAGLSEFTAGTAAFLRQGLAAGEGMLVIVNGEKIDALRAELGADVGRMRFEDIDEIGLNPARIIPAWREFVNENAAAERGFRGIGEPVSRDLTPAGLVESQRHESLLNLAFDGRPAWRLLCPYDVEALPEAVIAEALRSHPTISTRGTEVRSKTFRDLAAVAAPFDDPLSPPTVTPERTAFDLGSLSDVRTFVGNRAIAYGLTPPKASDLVLAVNEITTNSLRHGGGQGVLEIWPEAGYVLVEIRDTGHIDRPLIGRERPMPGSTGGLGVWLANQLCDLVQIRTFPDGSVVRIYMKIE